MVLLSLLRVQDNNILQKWCEKTAGLCLDCPFLFVGGGTRLDIIAHILMGCHAYFAWGHHLYFTNKTTSPLCKPLGNKLQECIAASSMQALIHLLPTLLWVFWKVLVQKCLFNLMKQKVLAKQTGSFKIKFNKNAIL